MPNLGFAEIMVILVIALLVFGPRRLPEIGRQVGKSMREFRRASSDFRNQLEFEVDEEEPPRVPAPNAATKAPDAAASVEEPDVTELPADLPPVLAAPAKRATRTRAKPTSSASRSSKSGATRSAASKRSASKTGSSKSSTAKRSTAKTTAKTPAKTARKRA